MSGQRPEEAWSLHNLEMTDEPMRTGGGNGGGGRNQDAAVRLQTALFPTVVAHTHPLIP